MEKHVRFSDVKSFIEPNDSFETLSPMCELKSNDDISDPCDMLEDELKDYASEIHTILNEPSILNSKSRFDDVDIDGVDDSEYNESSYERKIIDGDVSDNSDDDDAKFNIDLLNVFIKYYSLMYPEKKMSNMFEGIDITNIAQTNHIMELFYEAMKEYEDNYIINSKKTDETDTLTVSNVETDTLTVSNVETDAPTNKYQKCKVYIPSKFNIVNVDQCYGLNVDGKLEYVSELLFPLIICVADKFLLRDWIIINLK